MRRDGLLFIILASFALNSFASDCRELLGERVNLQLAASHKVGHIARRAREIANVIRKHEREIETILTKVDTVAGARYEIEQALRTLDGVESVEAFNLVSTRNLSNVAVYGSTNIPLYTLVLHGILPMFVAKDVWFRTPQATREVYASLHELLTKHLPEGELSNLHVLTDPKEVQYDKFRKRHVLGVNAKGNRLEAGPAEVVIFTGNPETGRGIVNQIKEKFEAMPEEFKGKKQVFLGFGAGMNPVVITNSAHYNLGQAIGAVEQSIRINSGQDCIAPNFYLVHKGVQPRFVQELLKRIHSMRAGPPQEKESDYSPLTLSEDLSKLVAYREKYKDYLVNPDANIDTITKTVSPHVFVFPIEMFGKVDLQEHYGPFVTLFTYKTEADLERVAKDERVQRKAMYTSVFGASRGSTDTQRAIDIFQQNRHGVSANVSVYADESGNVPFGGAGSDASVVSTIQMTENRGALVLNAHRPVLFSEEARLAFGKPIGREPLSNPPDFYRQKTIALLKESEKNPIELPQLPHDWSKLETPLREERPTGLEYLRSKIKEHGLVTAIPNYRPRNPDDVRKMEDFLGTKIIFKGEGTNEKAGVVLHPSGIGESAQTLNVYRGEVNPLLGHGLLLGLLDGNKEREYFLTEAISPGLMPATETFSDLRKSGALGEPFRKQGEKTRELLNRYLSEKINLSPEKKAELRRELTKVVEEFFSDIRKRFPQGAYIKNYGEFSTGDLGTLITSFTSNPSRIADHFLMNFESALRWQGGKPLSHPNVQNVLLQAHNDSNTKFLNALLSSPDHLLIQGRVDIAKTEMGGNMEFRVSFLDGEPVFVRNRFSHEYIPEEAEEAKRVVAGFFKNLPPEFAKLKYLAGGADVAKTTEGKWVVIEWNFGTAEGTLTPVILPIDYHLLLSSLQGKNSKVIENLKRVFESGPDAQNAYLKQLKVEKELWFKYSLNDISMVEVARHFRNLYLEKWRENPTEEAAVETLRQLNRMLDGVGKPDNEDLRKVRIGAESYLSRKLGKSLASP